MRRALIPLAVLSLAALAACTDNQVTGPRIGPEEVVAVAGGVPLGVMTQNMYVGADVDAVIAALATPDPSDDFAALQQAIGTLGATDFAARARVLAGEIGERRPAIVGLQEVSQIDIDLTPLGMNVVIHQDFLATLQAELSRRQLPYVLAAKVQNIHAAPFPGVSLVDWDAVLVDQTRVSGIHDVVAREYAFNIGTVAPGVSIQRGYVVFRATVGGRPLTIASTHLESGAGAQIAQLRAAQAAELSNVLAPFDRVILTGDMNDVPGSPMDQVYQAAGFTDSWAALRPNDAGLTCCHVPDLSDAPPAFTQRIDYIFSRGLAQPHAGLRGTIALTGLLPAERPSGPFGPIYISDHAGLSALLVTAGGN